MIHGPWSHPILKFLLILSQEQEFLKGPFSLCLSLVVRSVVYGFSPPDVTPSAPRCFFGTLRTFWGDPSPPNLTQNFLALPLSRFLYTVLRFDSIKVSRCHILCLGPSTQVLPPSRCRTVRWRQLLLLVPRTRRNLKYPITEDSGTNPVIREWVGGRVRLPRPQGRFRTGPYQDKGPSYPWA